MTITIIKPGLLATIQDVGRPGYGKYGVSVSGVMDSFSFLFANWLVGNDGKEAVLELTWSGFAACFEKDYWIAITGGDFAPQIDGIDVPMWRPVLVRKGSTLRFTKPVTGCRSYVAVAGGINVSKLLGSCSTYLRAGIGGFQGRALKPGDELRIHEDQSNIRQVPIEEGKSYFSVKWSISPTIFPSYHNHPVIRVIRGHQYEEFDLESQSSFLNERFQVTSESDRMGYRLSGSPLLLKENTEYLSEAVTMGTVQVPSNGQPIILMADRQTHGGYPKIAQVASVDLPVIAQVPPGGTIRFREVSRYEAERSYIEWGRTIKGVSKVIYHKLKENLHASN